MLYQTFKEILVSLVYASLFGTGAAVLFTLISILFDSASSLLSLPRHVAKASESIKSIKEFLKYGFVIGAYQKKQTAFIKDFISVIFTGVSYSILLYIATDGVFRLYVFAAWLIFFFIFRKNFSPHIEFLVLKLICFVYSFLVTVTSFVLMPIRKIFAAFYKFFVLKIQKRLSEKAKKLPMKRKTPDRKLCKMMKK